MLLSIYMYVCEFQVIPHSIFVLFLAYFMMAYMGGGVMKLSLQVYKISVFIE